MPRTLQPELLDSLSPDHPAAQHNRRDLRLINRAMGNFGWFARELPRFLRAGEKILELGAGTGELGCFLAARGAAVDGLDLWPRPAEWPAAQAWHQADLRTFGDYGAYPVVIANLILHQFSEAELADLGRRVAGARVILASEPERSPVSQVLMAAGGAVLGANYVTRHDARVSIQAGFRREELPRALGLDAGPWQFRCKSTALGAYRMVAVRSE